MPLTMLGTSLLLSGIGSLIGSAGAANATRKARDEEKRAYNKYSSYLDSEMYRDPLTSAGNRSILKLADQQSKDNLEAMNNTAAATGATMENRLAARKANNEVKSNLYARLLSNEDARRNSLNQMKMQNEMQHSLNIQRNYAQDAQNWASWGGNFSDAMMSLGNASALNGGNLNLKTMLLK